MEKKVKEMTFNQKMNDSVQYLCLFYLCSPSICHSDSDLSEGSRKYSPSSETSVETQRACGKRRYRQTWPFPRTHAHGDTFCQAEEELSLRASHTFSQILHKNSDESDERVLPHLLPCCYRRKQLLTSTHSCFFPPLLFFRPRPPLSGGFSETYSALCDYNGISCKEEVQWVRAVGLCRCECFRSATQRSVHKMKAPHTLQQTGSR